MILLEVVNSASTVATWNMSSDTSQWMPRALSDRSDVDNRRSSISMECWGSESGNSWLLVLHLRKVILAYFSFQVCWLRICSFPLPAVLVSIQTRPPLSLPSFPLLFFLYILTSSLLISLLYTYNNWCSAFFVKGSKNVFVPMSSASSWREWATSLFNRI